VFCFRRSDRLRIGDAEHTYKTVYFIIMNRKRWNFYRDKHLHLVKTFPGGQSVKLTKLETTFSKSLGMLPCVHIVFVLDVQEFPIHCMRKFHS
jgi:hypothetical protein